MKNLATLLIICLVTMSATAQRVNSDYFKYNDAVDFKVKFFTSSKTSNTGNDVAGTLNVARKGESFKQGVFEFRNNTDEDQVINFSELFIVDNAGRKHQAKVVTQAMKMTSNPEKLEMTLKSKKEKTFIIEFWPPFPKDQLPKLMVRDVLIDLPGAAK